MSSTTGWEPKHNSGKFTLSDEGWGASSAVTISSPLSHPDSWPQLGTSPDTTAPNLEMNQQQSHGFADNRQPPDSGGWGVPAANDSNVPGAVTGWGMPPANVWGGVNGGGSSWPRQNQVDNGTALWGKQSNCSGGWGASSSHWNANAPVSTSVSSAQTALSSHDEEHSAQVMPVTSSSVPTQQPESWVAAAATLPGQLQPSLISSAKQSVLKEADTNLSPVQSQHQPEQKFEGVESQDVASHLDTNDQVQKLVNSHEGWGKRPIQQNTSWDISDSPSLPPPSKKTGTEAWGKTVPSQQSSWQGTAGISDANTQKWSKPAGNPIRAWGALGAPLPPRPPWSGAQQAPPQTGWGDQRLPSATAINSSRWNTPSNSLANSVTQGWSNPGIQHSGWSNSAPADNAAWGSSMQRNTQVSNWSGVQTRQDGGWNQPQNIQRQSSLIDDGTSAWGDPTAYKHVSMWDKKPSVGMNLNAADQGKSEPVGWGTPRGPQGLENKPSPTGWGDNNSAKPVVDDGTSSWGKTNPNNSGSNWDQNPGWGVGKTNGNGWSSHAEQHGPQWGQIDNDTTRGKGKDFGFTDRKTSTGSDNVFEEGQLERNANGLGGDMGSSHSGVNFGHFPAAQPNNQGLNGPRPVPPQNLINPSLQGPNYRQGPPMPPHVQNQLQQIRHAVLKGVIPQHILNPQLMTPQHLNLLQQLVMKTAEYQQLSAKMNVFNKPNLPPQLRPQQEQLARMLRQCQQQIQAHQRALSQSMLKKSASIQEKGNMGSIGPNTGLGLDLSPASGAMPPANSGISPFSMSNISQSLPSSGSLNSREQSSRFHTWRRPSVGLDITSENSIVPALSSVMSHPSISDMIGARSGILTSPAEQGGLLGLRQLESRGNGTEQNNEVNDLLHRHRDVTEFSGNKAPNLTKEMTGGTPCMETDREASNLKSILADIGPPEFIPGKKWAGFRPIDPENDPDITPGSVAIAKTMSVNTVKDVDQVLNRDRYALLQVDNATTSSTEVATNAESQPARASSFANIPNDNTSAIVSPSTWSTGSGWSENKTWVVLANVNSQMDFGSLRSLCIMKGKMISFQPNCPVRGMVLVKYQTVEDAVSARNTLSMSFGRNSAVSVNIVSDQEVNGFMNASSGGNWNTGPTQVNRRSFGSSGTLLSNHPLLNPNFGPMMPNSDAMYNTGDTHSWSTGSNSGAIAPPHGHQEQSWSTSMSTAPGRAMGTNMWNNSSFTGYDDASIVVSPPNSLLPENLLGEQPL